MSTSLAPQWTGGTGEELLEGTLVCGTCAGEYPVVLGVALLVGGLDRYLGAYLEGIQECAREVSASGISHDMVELLRTRCGPAQDRDSEPWSQNLPAVTARYLQAHFDPDTLPSDLPSGWWRHAVEQYLTTVDDPYRYLIDCNTRFRKEGAAPEGLAVDVGASVGRSASELSRNYAYSLGLDWSFRAVLAARRYLLRVPTPLESYELSGDSAQSPQQPLPRAELGPNLDFVVGDAAALPVRTGTAACVSALNVMCVLPEPPRLLDEATRVLFREGMLLFSSPFSWDPEALDEEALAAGGPGYVRLKLAGKFSVLDEAEDVPWVVRLARRFWTVYLCHCIVATRL